MDFAKAFDRVNHSLLLHKLHYYSITEKINAWIGNFLQGQQQAVVVDGAKSGYVPVESGVPQGTAIGPSLFLRYINDLSQQTDSKSTLFTDDSIYVPANNLHSGRPADTPGRPRPVVQVGAGTRWNMCFHPDTYVSQTLRVVKPVLFFPTPQFPAP